VQLKEKLGNWKHKAVRFYSFFDIYISHGRNLFSTPKDLWDLTAQGSAILVALKIIFDVDVPSEWIKAFAVLFLTGYLIGGYLDIKYVKVLQTKNDIVDRNYRPYYQEWREEIKQGQKEINNKLNKLIKNNDI